MPSTTLARGNISVSVIIGPTLTPVAVAANTTAGQNFTIAGLQLLDVVGVNLNGAQTAGVGIANAYVSAVNTLTVLFSNGTAGSLTPVSGVYLITVDRAESLPLPVSAV